MHADELRRAIDAADRITLPAVTALLWRAYADGHLSDDEAEALSAGIEARQSSETRRIAGQSSNPTGTAVDPHRPQDRQNSPRTAAGGSGPRTGASIARRRRWAASGRLPPALACRFTLAEQAALAVIAVEVAKRGDCRLAVGAVAALAGVSETTVRNAVREARQLGLLTVEERRLARYRNETNVVRIVSAEWSAWLRLARASERGAAPRQSGGGCRTAKGTTTGVSYPVNPGGRSTRKGIRGSEITATGGGSRMYRHAG